MRVVRVVTNVRVERVVRVENDDSEAWVLKKGLDITTRFRLSKPIWLRALISLRGFE